MRLAAAAILAQTKATAEQGIAILEQARPSASSDVDKLNLSLALLEGYSSVEDYAKELAIAADLEAKYPESKRAFYANSYTLRALGRSVEADELAQKRLKRLPDDLDALRVLASNASSREDYRAAHDWHQKIVDTGKAEAQDLNGKAWDTLFYNRTEGPDTETAIKATQLSQNNANILHTLGCLYADAGKTKEAREVLVQAMDIQELDEPDPNYWYAFGRIAEQFGEREAALANYAKVTKPKKAIEIPDSTYRLAQNRLKILQGESGAATAP